jgi:hypothetical protein
MGSYSLSELRALKSRKNSRAGTVSFFISIAGLAVLLVWLVSTVLTPGRGSRDGQETNILVLVLSIFSPPFGAILSTVGLAVAIFVLRKKLARKLSSVVGLWLNAVLLTVFVVVSILTILDLLSHIPFA